MSRQINLFDPVFVRRRKYFSAMDIAGASGLIVIGAAILAVYANYQLSGLSKELAATSAQLELTKAQLTKVNAGLGPRQKNKPLEDELVTIEAEVKSQQQVFDTLQKGEFGNTRGYSEYLRAFSRQIVDGLWLTGFSIHGAGNEIAIQGRALQPELVSAYISRLKREPVMSGKSFAVLEMRVPQAAQANKGDAAAAKQRAPAAYIEFNLQSSGMPKEPAESSGANSK